MGETNNRLTPTETAIAERGNNDSSTNPTSKKRGRPPGTTRTEKEILPGLADVEPKVISIELPGTEPTEEPKKKPGRPAGTKKPAPAKNQKVDSTQIQLLLITMSGLLASRPGMEVWNLTTEEAKQIAEPLSKILAKNQALANVVGEHADSFALVTACFMIFLPKFIMYQAMKPKKPKQGEKINYGLKPVAKPPQQERTLGGSNQSNVRPSTSDAKNVNQNFSGQLHDLIPSIGGF